MKAKLDRTLCGGRGVCATHDSDLFVRDEWGYTTLSSNDIPADRVPAVRMAIADCPFGAISEYTDPAAAP